MKTTLSCLLLSGIVMLGCGAEDHQSSETKPISLLASIPQATGNVVELYEGLPGMILVSEDGLEGNPLATRSSKLAGLNILQAYDVLSNHAAPPAALVEAAAREQDLIASGQLQRRAAQPAKGELLDSTSDNAFYCTDSTFLTSYCGSNAQCVLNLTSPSAFNLDNVYTYSGAVCTRGNSVRVTIYAMPWWSWNQVGGPWTVLTGHVRTWSYWSYWIAAGCDFDGRTAIDTVSAGAVYQFTAR